LRMSVQYRQAHRRMLLPRPFKLDALGSSIATDSEYT
jgi:hypothetical protein